MFELTGQDFQKLGKVSDVFQDKKEEKIGFEKIGTASQVFPKKNILKDIGAGVKETGEHILGIGEGLFSAASGLASFIPSVAGGLIGLIGSGLGINTPKEAGKLSHSISELGTWEPKTEILLLLYWGKV